MDHENQEDIRTLKDTLRRQINGLLKVLALVETGGVSHLDIMDEHLPPISEYCLFNLEDKPVLFHNLVALVQELGCWLWTNIRHHKAEADLALFNKSFKNIIGEDEHPESLRLPELQDHYQQVLFSDGQLELLWDQIEALVEVIRKESVRVTPLVKSARRSGYWVKARREETSYFHLRLILNEKLLSFFRKFLNAETALNGPQN